ncbi:hypothetical protein AK812_SmicGene22934 [Symbiodinium microadriaticum]|uniref:Uncharacterized protein n=1 Tax=Symbiodinium microadriaticum TaxID=2951 RepID=A0A1Q9DIH2_SYMMI|nr:hypothetical protein AK812_SmicGene22934 [Symbiodinium microadriaticum]CAE7219309.1 unnamed protein product [Symbiodinium microadriaticum]
MCASLRIVLHARAPWLAAAGAVRSCRQRQQIQLSQCRLHGSALTYCDGQDKTLRTDSALLPAISSAFTVGIAVIADACHVQESFGNQAAAQTAPDAPATLQRCGCGCFRICSDCPLRVDPKLLQTSEGPRFIALLPSKGAMTRPGSKAGASVLPLGSFGPALVQDLDDLDLTLQSFLPGIHLAKFRKLEHGWHFCHFLQLHARIKQILQEPCLLQNLQAPAALPDPSPAPSK